MGWLDESSGELLFDELTLVIGPELRLSTLRAHADGARFTPFLSNPPHESVLGDGHLDETAFGVVVFFEDDSVTRVSLTLDDPNVIGTSWADYDPEVARRAHDAWLEARLGTGSAWHKSSYPYGGVEYRYKWGGIGSFLHPQDQTASITVSYGRD